MTEFHINLAGIRDFPGFVSAFNAGMIDRVGGHWNGNLNAFNDYLCWPEVKTYQLVLTGWDHCVSILNEAQLSNGSSILNAIHEIFADNPHVTVIFA